MRYCLTLISRIGLFGHARAVPADIFDTRLARIGLREARRQRTSATVFRY
jgi:hypothetical protein